MAGFYSAVDKTAFIITSAPWGNGYYERFDARFLDELLNGEVVTTLREARTLIERWRRHSNAFRPHSSSGYRPPAPKSIVPIDQKPTVYLHSN
ncbi:integrase core domain-containing protein [Palleronia sp. THAF1]|uniref:integrase core domain-containing protein n=1 Tax=Palleronia sp. THAF1 TaxID=2587842 RepID=UPI001562B9B2